LSQSAESCSVIDAGTCAGGEEFSTCQHASAVPYVLYPYSNYYMKQSVASTMLKCNSSLP
jgi:hypothetical protein